MTLLLNRENFFSSFVLFGTEPVKNDVIVVVHCSLLLAQEQAAQILQSTVISKISLYNNVVTVIAVQKQKRTMYTVIARYRI
jgi:hypothetical protein